MKFVEKNLTKYFKCRYRSGTRNNQQNVMKGVKEAPEIEAAAGSEQVGTVKLGGQMATGEINKGYCKKWKEENSKFCTERFRVRD